MNHIDIIGGQESWDLDNVMIYVPAYKWFCKPRESIKGKRGEGWLTKLLILMHGMWLGGE